MRYQNHENIDGGVAEVGIHHGKTFIALCLGLVEKQKAYGIDVFGNQSENLDGSGLGDRCVLERHLKDYNIPASSVVIDGRASQAVAAEDILAAVGEVRFFSVDGGHWRDVVANDLELSEKVLTSRGVIALDDFLRPEWPDVSAGFFDWYRDSKKEISPFAIGFNKLYLCKKEHVVETQKVLEESTFLKHYITKHYTFLGNRIPIFQQTWLPEWNLRRRLNGYLGIHHPELFVRLCNLLPKRLPKAAL
jgi:hypothetical protein